MPVLPNRIAGLDVGERDLVADRHVHPGGQVEGGVVGGDHAGHVGAGPEAFDDDDTDGVLWVMHEEMGDGHASLPWDLTLNLPGCLALDCMIVLPSYESGRKGKSMTEPVKLGLVGLGRWARVLTRAAARSDKLKITACFTRTADKREAFAVETGIPAVAD